ncbi:collectin-11, partial [Biomphalaria glabrata]
FQERDLNVYPPLMRYDTIYYISKATFVSYTEASKWCSQNLGGYPAEIDNAEELGSIERYATSTNLRGIFIAGTDAKKKGKFLSQRTGAFIHIFNWANEESQNDNRGKNCLELNGSGEGRMNRTPCNTATISHNVLCEVVH